MARQPQQLTLWPNPTEAKSRSPKASHAVADTTFSGNKTAPVHRWVPWIAGFSKDFVCEMLAQYAPPPGGLVLDPFAGVGTTLVEAQLAGYDVAGYEINPYAHLATEVKLQTHAVESYRLRQQIQHFTNFYTSRLANHVAPTASQPRHFRSKTAFFSPRVLTKVLHLLDYLTTIPNTTIQTLFRIAFASTMVTYSNYSYEPSLSTRASAGRPDIPDFPVGEHVIDKLLLMLDDVEWRQRTFAPSRASATLLVNESFLTHHHLLTGLADMVITSPPYLNNYHYTRNTRPQLFWLGLADTPDDLRQLETNNFGMFWQTVRAGEALSLDFPLPDSDLAERIQRLRALNPDKGIYGGHGWANYSVQYFNDCFRLASCLHQVVKPAGHVVIVIGNSLLQGISFPVEVYLTQIMNLVGFEAVNVFVPRTTRVGNSIIRSQVRVGKAQQRERLYETVAVYRHA